VLAIELEKTFSDKLRRRWPTVEVVCASAVDLEQILKERTMTPVDHFISGLPFASLRVDEINRILDGIQHTLKPGGTFTTFQYLHGYGLSPGRFFRREMSRRMETLPVRKLVLKNFPFSFMLSWRKPDKKSPTTQN
jgi:phospholipid N-methyltransferase